MLETKLSQNVRIHAKANPQISLNRPLLRTVESLRDRYIQRRRVKDSHNSTAHKQNGRLTLNLHLVTTTNFKVWSFPKISSLHKMSSCQDREKCFRKAGKDSVHQPPPPRLPSIPLCCQSKLVPAALCVEAPPTVKVCLKSESAPPSPPPHPHFIHVVRCGRR